MAKRSKEEREEERKKELLRTLRRGPDLDRFIDEQKRNFVSYAKGTRIRNLGKIIKDGILSNIGSIHRVTIDRAVERKLKSSDFN